MAFPSVHFHIVVRAPVTARSSAMTLSGKDSQQMRILL